MICEQVQGQTGQVKDSDHDAYRSGYPGNGQGISSRIDHRRPERPRPHAIAPGKPAHEDAGPACIEGGLLGAEPVDQERDDHEERQEEEPTLLQDFQKHRQLLSGHSFDVVLGSLDLDQGRKAHIIERGRNGSDLDNLEVGNSCKLYHEEGRGTHHGRCEHAPGRCTGLHGARHFRTIPRLFHERNGEGPGSYHVRGRAAGDHAHQRGTRHSHLRGPGRIFAQKCIGEFDKKPSDA